MIQRTGWVLLLAGAVFSCGSPGPSVKLPVAPAGKMIKAGPMVLVPAGFFVRGGSDNDRNKKGIGGRKEIRDSVPIRRIYLDGFFIDKFEVTNADYARFVSAVGHLPPSASRGGGVWGGTWERFEWSGVHPPPGAGDIPVTLISWFDAEAYCAWVGKRLPTEAEWEKAARGAAGKTYPWGDSISSGAGNFGKQHEGPLPVGSFSSDRSVFGAMDMAGNVAEWVNDYYHSAYYGNSPDRNPRGPRRGSRRVIRGGYWSQPADRVRAHKRWSGVPSEKHGGVGFRCARSEVSKR